MAAPFLTPCPRARPSFQFPTGLLCSAAPNPMYWFSPNWLFVTPCPLMILCSSQKPRPQISDFLALSLPNQSCPRGLCFSLGSPCCSLGWVPPDHRRVPTAPPSPSLQAAARMLLLNSRPHNLSGLFLPSAPQLLHSGHLLVHILATCPQVPATSFHTLATSLHALATCLQVPVMCLHVLPTCVHTVMCLYTPATCLLTSATCSHSAATHTRTSYVTDTY